MNDPRSTDLFLDPAGRIGLNDGENERWWYCALDYVKAVASCRNRHHLHAEPCRGCGSILLWHKDGTNAHM